MEFRDHPNDQIETWGTALENERRRITTGIKERGAAGKIHAAKTELFRARLVFDDRKGC